MKYCSFGIAHLQLHPCFADCIIYPWKNIFLYCSWTEDFGSASLILAGPQPCLKCTIKTHTRLGTLPHEEGNGVLTRCQAFLWHGCLVTFLNFFAFWSYVSWAVKANFRWKRKSFDIFRPCKGIAAHFGWDCASCILTIFRIWERIRYFQVNLDCILCKSSFFFRIEFKSTLL